ncbi:reverse transcriptase [Cucumis melo var. makuwa]|uniref:Reverse transcriptase n=1 Tax=Cucumis melo var. makuwa TaxID=1194695 RepID=A0A5D3D2P7_CUCMM|nr:reverse transcriptase [Cucumis melo var. makuwa]
MLLHVKETASTSQPIGPTVSQTNSPTLSVIAQSNHLTGFLEHFVSYTSCVGNEKIQIANGSLASIITRELHCKATFLPESVCFQNLNSGRMIATARHSRGLYVLNDDTFAAHLINRMPTRILHLQTPLECLKEFYPSTCLVSEVPLRVFGCTAYVHSFGPNQTKFFPRAQACVFVGYPPHQRGYKCFHPSSRKYFVTMDVTFCEDRPYFLISHLQGESEESHKGSQVLYQSATGSSPRLQTSLNQGMENSTEPCTDNTMNENDRFDIVVLENMEEKNSGDETEVRTETSNNEAAKAHTGKLDKYDPSLDLPIALRKGTRSCTKHSISNYVSYKNLSPQFRAFTTNIDSITIPKNIHIALECPKWKNVVMEVRKALEKNNIWEICALPRGHNHVGCKWVFTLKYKADGTLDRHKARVLLFVAVNKDWPLYQLDVKNSFLNGDLVEVYMSPPLGFEAQFGQ